MEKDYGEMIIYQTPDGMTQLDVRLLDDTVWLSQVQMAELFQTSKQNISLHINNCFKEGELEKETTVKESLTVATNGRNYKVQLYNLDVIISVGYRVKSMVGTHFRRWAMELIKEYMNKGFAMDDERLKGNGGGSYWRELLDRIRDIRSSEKVLYRQVLDLYATSVDYDPKSEESIRFFKIVQNKLHYAAHGHTAPEIIYERADAEQPFMGLRTFSGTFPIKRDVTIAKNYLDESELKILNNLVSGYFDLAEISAMEHRPMYMSDYVQQLDSILTSGGRPLLTTAGSISHQQAVNKATAEYEKFQVKTLSPVEVSYLESIKEAQKAVKKK